MLIIWYMPRIKKGPGTSLNRIEIEDAIDSNDLVDTSTTIETECGNIVPAIVKMKLNTFCDNVAIKNKLNFIVIEMNRLLGEAYLFANIHVTRLISENKAVPLMDRNFYYRCILASSKNKCRSSTIGPELEMTKTRFDALRQADSPKVDICEYNQIVADLSIIMATMASNHLWMNLEPRLKKFIRWKYPTLKGVCKRIIDSVIDRPTISLDRLYKDADDSPRLLQAKKVSAELRSLLPLPSKSKFASRAHLTLPLYFHILQETTSKKTNEPSTTKGLKLFNLLPLKSNFTISHIPISNMMMMRLLKECKLEEFKGDGRSLDHRKIWSKYFNLNGVETKARKFGNRIITDGCSVSILLEKKTCVVCNCENTCDNGELKLLMHEKEIVQVIGLDPGFTDIACWTDLKGITKRYSSAKYYEHAKYNVSRRRIDAWNAETASIVTLIPPSKTASLDELEAFGRVYLEHLPLMIRHRFSKGYRNMRFLRYVNKKNVIKQICDEIAPPEKISIIGFGDWNGGVGTPIKRRCAGPLQEIKMELKGRDNVRFISIPEFGSSKHCYLCHCELSNMRAECTKVRRAKGSTAAIRTTRVTKIHKVLHCNSSQIGSSNQCGTTWNRDVNASKNILMLTMCKIYGYERPSAFCRVPKI